MGCLVVGRQYILSMFTIILFDNVCLSKINSVILFYNFFFKENLILFSLTIFILFYLFIGS